MAEIEGTDLLACRRVVTIETAVDVSVLEKMLAQARVAAVTDDLIVG